MGNIDVAITFYLCCYMFIIDLFLMLIITVDFVDELAIQE